LLELAGRGHLRLPETWLSRFPTLINKILYPLAVLLFAVLVPQIAAVFALPFVAGTFNPNDPTSLGFTILLVASFAPIFLLIWLWLRLAEKRPLWTTGMERPWLKPYLRGLLVGLAMFGTAVALLAALGFLALERPLVGLGSLPVAAVLFIFLGWMVQGAAEELLTRGFLLPILGIRWGTAVGVLVSSLLFSLLHLANPNINAISILNLALFGLFAALYALHEGGLWGVFALHAVWNWAQGNLFGFAVSGMEIESGTLVDLMEAGPDQITGGLFGPEGGLVVTLVLVLSILLVGWAARRSVATQAAAGEHA
jgi:membrane protease YdiL (CAAX protease family)